MDVSEAHPRVDSNNFWFEGATPPHPGEAVAVSDGIHMFLANNPSAWTFEGTNTWVLTDGGHAVVFDPGPEEPEHQGVVAQWLADRELLVEHILVSHGHGDHAGGARALAALTGLVGITDLRLAESGMTLPFGAGSTEWLRVYRTPGHTSDGVTLLWDRQRVALVGDTALSRVNPYIHHPDGTVRDILQSMNTIAGLVDDSWMLLPGHGPVISNPRAHLTRRIASRHRRIDEVRTHYESGMDEEQIVSAMYGDRDATTRIAAVATVRALLAYIREGQVT